MHLLKRVKKKDKKDSDTDSDFEKPKKRAKLDPDGTDASDAEISITKK